jgi:hypothetical protein
MMKMIYTGLTACLALLFYGQAMAGGPDCDSFKHESNAISAESPTKNADDIAISSNLDTQENAASENDLSDQQQHTEVHKGVEI